MTAIQQFWLIGIPTILTSSQYPVSQKDEQQLVPQLALTSGLIKPRAFTDDNIVTTSVALTAGASISLAQFNTQVDENVLSPSLVLTAGVRNYTAAFNIQTDIDQTLQSAVTLTAGARAVVAVFNTQADEQTLTASLTLTAGVRT